MTDDQNHQDDPSAPGPSPPIPYENMATSPENQAIIAGIMADRPPPVGVDPRAWVLHACMMDVYKWMAKHRTRNVSKACAATGWPRNFYYLARDDPYAAGLASREIAGIQAAAAEVAAGRMVQIVANVASIAAKGEGVAAVRAAQWVAQYLDGHQDDLDTLHEAAQVQPGKSAAILAMERFPGGGRIRKTTTTVEEVIEPDVIDVTPPGDTQ
jgi:hypothetical protein